MQGATNHLFRRLYITSRKFMDNLGFLINCEKVILRKLEHERERLNRRYMTVGCPKCREAEVRIRELERRIELHSGHLTDLLVRKMMMYG